MSSPLKHVTTAQSTAPIGIRLAASGLGQSFNSIHGARRRAEAPIEFPKRPDLTDLSKSIPLFYVGRNKLGFWVAREAEGCSGGLFLRQRSALRFVRMRSRPAGCATMFLTEPFELDVENQGSGLVALIISAIDVVTRRAPALADFIGMTVAEWRRLVAEISRALAGERRNRAAIERELFHGEYRLSSKNDDDLPIP